MLMVMKAVEQLLRQVDWSDTDVLVIDMLPGTGDTHLSIPQFVPISGALLVSTPEDYALADAKKTPGMLQQRNIPILGLVNNMSFFTWEKCHHQTRIFARSDEASGIEAMAHKFGTTVLRELPLFAWDHKEHWHDEVDGLKKTARIYKALAERVWDELESARTVSEGGLVIMDPLTRRLLKELREVKQLEKNGDGGEGVVELGPVAEEDLTEWRCVLQGPSGSPYEGGTFTLKIQVPPTYPLQPPTITFKTRVCHPNVHLKTGEICLDVLKNAWTPAWSLHSACMAVGVLLTSPEADSPLNCDAANLLRAGDERGYNSLVRMHVRLHAAKK